MEENGRIQQCNCGALPQPTSIGTRCLAFCFAFYSYDRIQPFETKIESISHAPYANRSFSMRLCGGHSQAALHCSGAADGH